MLYFTAKIVRYMIYDIVFVGDSAMAEMGVWGPKTKKKIVLGWCY